MNPRDRKLKLKKSTLRTLDPSRATRAYGGGTDRGGPCHITGPSDQDVCNTEAGCGTVGTCQYSAGWTLCDSCGNYGCSEWCQTEYEGCGWSIATNCCDPTTGC